MATVYYIDYNDQKYHFNTHLQKRLLVNLVLCLRFHSTQNIPLQIPRWYPLPNKSPLAVRLVLSSTYPSLQEHTKLPGVLVQVCSHGDDEHSSMSMNNISN